VSAASGFLTALAQALSTMTLYKDGHPARERAVDLTFERLKRLQEEVPHPRFTFLGDEIVLGQRPVRDMRNWDWGSRLATAGVQRLEFPGAVTREELDAFLDQILGRLVSGTMDTSESRQTRASNIRFGIVGMKGEAPDSEPQEPATATLAYTLREEAEAVRWVHQELQGEGGLQLAEAEAVVRSLSVAMHADQVFLIPLLRLKEYDQYTTTHAMNVATLTMALAEFIGLSPRDIRMFGMAGLLHDLGKVKVPEEILNKPGKFTDREREIMNGHPVEGARIILNTERDMDLAAVVAYEHHIMLNGGGYPRFRFPRKCHPASDLVHVCDVFDALRTDRPYRDAWPMEKVLTFLSDGAGTEFEPNLAHAFSRMIRQWETRVTELENEKDGLSFEADTNASPSSPDQG